MRKAANSGFIVTGPSSREGLTELLALRRQAAIHRRLSVQLIEGVCSDRLFADLGDKLIALAEQAYGLRQGESVEELSRTMLAAPLPARYKSAGRYFLALGLRRQGEHEKGNLILEGVATEPTHTYTARATQSLGAVFQDRGDLESALKLYVEAGRRAAENGRVDPTTAVFAQKNIAAMRGLTGDHRRALAELERLWPLVKTVSSIHPHLYYDFQNSVAVELGKLGRLEEAAHYSRIAVSSVFSAAYPEWRETLNEIDANRRRPSRSAVIVRREAAFSCPIEEEDVRRTQNIIHLPMADRLSQESPTERPAQVTRARVLNFRRRKTAITASKSGMLREGGGEQRTQMTTGEKLIRLMDLISQDETDDETIDRILKAVEQIVLNRRNEKLD